MFLRGGLLLLVADSPQRTLMYKGKHPNKSTRFPCIYCMVEQAQEEAEGEDGTDPGGALGDPLYDIESNARTRGGVLAGRRRLWDMKDQASAQAKMSTELGVVAPASSDERWLLYDVMDIVPGRTMPVEILHADALVSALSDIDQQVVP